jgi:hypothetical protein
MVDYSRVKGECQRCGFVRRLSELKTEWTGLKVCADVCWDPKPAELKAPPIKPEGVPVPGAAPQTIPIEREEGDHGWDQEL